MKWLVHLFPTLLLASCCTAALAGNAYLRPHDKVACVGDSITAAGVFVQFVQDTLRTLYPDADITLLNQGSGGARADAGVNVIARYSEGDTPTVVLCMFGVNDTGWNPAGLEAKITNYTSALQKTIVVTQQKGLPLIFLRETHFSHGGNPAPDAFEVKITDLLDRLQAAQTTLAAEQHIPLIDVRGAYARALAQAWTKDPAYEFTPDIIHPSSLGHAAIACELLRAFGAGLPLSQADGPRGALQLTPATDIALSLADGQGIVDVKGNIALTVTVDNQANRRESGKLVVTVAGQKFEKSIALRARRATRVTFMLPAAALKDRYAITPVYMAFLGQQRFAADGGLLFASRIQPAGKTPVNFTAADFATVQPDGRTCPVTAVCVQRADELCTIDFTWHDTTPVPAQANFTDRFGTRIPTPLNMRSREGQPCDAVEFFLDVRPLETIGRQTANIDDNPRGILRLGVYRELTEGRVVAGVIAEPTQPADAVTLTALGEDRYRLQVRTPIAAPCAGFSMRVTDNTTFKNASTPPFYLTLHPGTGQEPMTYVQLGDENNGIVYRLGY